MGLFVFIVAKILFLFAGNASYQKLSSYNLSNPNMKWQLPSVLHEISGLTELDSTSFACIQDENGVLFFYDIRNNRISRELIFGYNGDYEGIARVGKTIYVLRSDGVLFEIPDYNATSGTADYHSTNIPALNNEGLCYDAPNSRLLIGCKGRVDKGPENRDLRMVYAFDLKTRALLPEPVFEFDVRALTDFAHTNKIIPETRTNKKGKVKPALIRLNTSEIAIHPLTRQLYLLSATDHLLMVFDLEGNVKHIEPLDPLLFNKPEGITFFANGDMLITNEGQQGVPSLLRFNFRKKNKK